ncbi:MAG: diacylglycerol kinase [Proteobacteria bacterium]|nr:diacylglycerol kinase [Pseudomonadota bacterium]MCL2306670.1 diacylglycerol kinase [Pseudomonadota bacterium]
MKRLINAFSYSLHGLAAAWRDEAAFRQLALLAIIGIIAACFLPLSATARVLLIGAHGLTLVVELLNSAIEATIDRISEERHPLSKKAKDCGSAAQMVMLILLAALWGAALWGCF